MSPTLTLYFLSCLLTSCSGELDRKDDATLDRRRTLAGLLAPAQTVPDRVTSEVISFHVITNRQINIIATTAQKTIHKRRSSISMIDKYISIFHKYYERVCVRSCVCAYVRMCMRSRARACVRACVRASQCVFG